MKDATTICPLRFILLLLAMLPLSGCGVLILGGAAAGTVGYVSGDLEATINGGFYEVVRATDRAIGDNSISVTSKTSSSHDVTYLLRTPQGDKVELTIIYATRALTNITIRVGVFGDEPLSRQILREIETRLQ
jgi:hypothetical protein